MTMTVSFSYGPATFAMEFPLELGLYETAEDKALELAEKLLNTDEDPANYGLEITDAEGEGFSISQRELKHMDADELQEFAEWYDRLANDDQTAACILLSDMGPEHVMRVVNNYQYEVHDCTNTLKDPERYIGERVYETYLGMDELSKDAQNRLRGYIDYARAGHDYLLEVSYCEKDGVYVVYWD